ncbi:hypothetical protein DV736_g6038, partial [Chaetothyriales sp. CBS 134916]
MENPDDEDFIPPELSESESTWEENQAAQSRSPSLIGSEDHIDSGSDYHYSQRRREFGLPTRRRWNRSNDGYNEIYMSLFRETFAADEDVAKAFKTSQYGTVKWNADEKAAFFKALARCGRTNVQEIAARIGSKSQVEVKAYIDLLESAELDRQYFTKQTKNVSKAEIPAAVEIDVDVERGLEVFADALEAYQDRYDQALGAKRTGDSLPWLITPGIAERLDSEVSEAYEDASDSEVDPAGELASHDMPHRLLKLSMMIELSEKVFMIGSKNAEYEHWAYNGSVDEHPSMTSEAVREFYELTVSFLRRILQTAIFLSQSRIRSCTNVDRLPKNEVKLVDVVAMRQVLNLQSDSWDFWTTLPRKANLRVIRGNHDHGHGSTRIVPYSEVEAALSIRHRDGKRRSLSLATDRSIGNSSGSDSLADLDDPDDSDDLGEIESSREKISREGFAEYDQPIPAHVSTLDLHEQPIRHGGRQREPEFDYIVKMADETDSDDEPRSQPSVSASSMDLSEARHISRIPSRKRRRIEEEALEIYMQDLDALSSVQEEKRLDDLLKVGEVPHPAHDWADFGYRPRVRRKTEAEVNRWKAVYRSQWETHDLDEFQAFEHPTKESEQPEHCLLSVEQ